MKKEYYKYTPEVDALKEKAEPEKADLGRLLSVISGDNELINYFYKDNANTYWLELLAEASEFNNPPDAVEEGGAYRYPDWPPGRYLSAVADKEPEQVLEIIKDIDTDNVWVMRNCLEALGKMPVEVAAGGVGLVKRLLRKEFSIHWHFMGEDVAKLIAKFAEGETWDEAFGIAKELLSVKIKASEHFRSWHDLEGRFDDYGYKELVFKYFKVLWEKDKQGLRAGELLVDILDRQIEAEQKRKDEEPIPEEIEKKYKEIYGECKKEPFEITVHSYIMMPQIESVEEKRSGIANILVGAIRTIGEYLMQNDPDEAEKYIELLQGKRRSLYERIVIHLHRYAPGDEKWKQRIKEIIRVEENVDNPNTRNEYKSLLCDKYEILDDDDKKPFFDWVEERVKIDDMEDFQKWYQGRHGRRAEDYEIEQYQNYLRAKELYCIKDKEPKYQEYLEESGKTEKVVEPKPRSAMGYSPGAPKFSPISREEMKEKAPEEVIQDIRGYDSDHEDKEEFSEEDGHEVDRKDALANQFSNDLKERLEDYLQVEVSLISELSERYIRNFLYAIREAVQNKKIEEPSWDTIIELCKAVYDSRLSDERYRSTMEAIPSIFELALRGKEHRDKITSGHLETIWGILVSLLDYQYEMGKEEDEDDYDDPHQTCINRVRGVAFENIIRFGLFCKNHPSDLFAEEYADTFRKTLQHVLNEVEQPYILCVFGVFFVNLCWLDEGWVREKLDRIFSENDKRKWDAVWGSYICWGQPTRLAFEIAKGKYSHAVTLIKEKMTDEGGEEKYDNRLMEHIMLGYWQGWTGLEENGVIRKLLAKMDDPMRARASHWLSTGFEYLKDHEKDEWRDGVIRRMREYWKWRYAEMENEPSAHRQEARQFTRWVKDSPFESEETLSNTEKTVRLADGVASRMRDVADFVEGVCALGGGRELRALGLLQQAINDPEVERWDWQGVEEPLKAFMDAIVELQDDYPNVREIRQAAIQVADSLGRIGFEYLRQCYDKLAEKK